MKKNQEEMNITENPLYHDTWKLLKKYRDVVWSLELSVQQVRNRFEIEYGSSIEDFLESVLHLPLSTTAAECGRDYRETAPSYPGYQLPHLLPQKTGGY